MLVGDRGHEPLASGDFADQPLRLDRKAHEADVDPASAESLDLRLRCEVLKEDFGRWRVLAKNRERPSQELPVRFRRDPDDDFLGFFSRRLPRQPGRALGCGQDPTGFLKKPASRRRQLDVALDPAQEVDFELGFEIPDLLAQGRLRGVQAVRGAAEMELFRDRDEVTKVPQLHSVPFDQFLGPAKS